MHTFLVALLLSGGVPASGAAVASTSVLAWSTYLRSAPTATAAALDEVEHGVRVRVLGCSAAWCRVSTAAGEGYVDRDALQLPPPPAPNAAASDCAVAPQAIAQPPAPTRFCSPAPGG